MDTVKVVVDWPCAGAGNIRRRRREMESEMRRGKKEMGWVRVRDEVRVERNRGAAAGEERGKGGVALARNGGGGVLAE